MSTEIHYKTFEEYFYESEAKNRKLQSRIKELEDAYTILDDCYKDQEKTIKKLESAVSELSEGLEFYASKKAWYDNYVVNGLQMTTVFKDSESFLCEVESKHGVRGGKKAREIITKHKDLIESINKDER